jgi:hypothetical protein
MVSESPPCGDELGGEVTGQGHPQEVMTGVVNHVVVAMAATPHGWLLMWTGLILAIQTRVLFLTLGMGQIQ